MDWFVSYLGLELILTFGFGHEKLPGLSRMGPWSHTFHLNMLCNCNNIDFCNSKMTQNYCRKLLHIAVNLTLICTWCG